MSSGIKRYLTMGVRYDGLKTMVNMGTNFQKTADFITNDFFKHNNFQFLVCSCSHRHLMIIGAAHISFSHKKLLVFFFFFRKKNLSRKPVSLVLKTTKHSSSSQFCWLLSKSFWHERKHPQQVFVMTSGFGTIKSGKLSRITRIKMSS